MKKPKYTVAINSIIGTRDEQEDYAFHCSDGKKVIAVVCDGMGGHESGQLASRLTVDKFRALYDEKNSTEALPVFYLKVVDILDELVFHLKNEQGERLGAGTTFVAAAIENNDLFWLSVGDSRLYILRDNELVQVTRDHNYFLRLEQMKHGNEISANQYEAEAVRGEALISFIGMGGIEVMDINHLPFKLQSKDTVLLSTDGLYKTLCNDEIKQCLRMENAEDALADLINKVEAKAHKFQDNTTCVLIKYNEEVEHETD